MAGRRRPGREWHSRRCRSRSPGGPCRICLVAAGGSSFRSPSTITARSWPLPSSSEHSATVSRACPSPTTATHGDASRPRNRCRPERSEADEHVAALQQTSGLGCLPSHRGRQPDGVDVGPNVLSWSRLQLIAIRWLPSGCGRCRRRSGRSGQLLCRGRGRGCRCRRLSRYTRRA